MSHPRHIASSEMNAFVSLPTVSPFGATSARRSHHPLKQSTMSRSHFASPFRVRSLPSFTHNGPTMVQEKPPIPQAPTYTDIRRERIASLILSGPVFKSAGLIISDLPVEEGCSTDSQQTCLDDWLRMGALLEKALGRQANDVRVYQYYLPIYFWVLREVDRHNDSLAESGDTHRPFILGFCCPQGGGKTTMTAFLEILLRTAGKRVEIASLDDFYLTNAEQQQVANNYPGNRLMQYRGMPGTHDLALLNNTLDSLRRGEQVNIPKYDKTAFNGRGDRAPEKTWKSVSDATDIVLFEGWCLGFEPLPEHTIADPDLVVVNQALKDFTSMYKRLDGMFIIEIQNMDWVFDWRLQAERGSRAAGRPGLSDEQVKDFVSRFMPAYKHYTPQLYHRSQPLFPAHELHIEIDQMRRPVHRNSDY